MTRSANLTHTHSHLVYFVKDLNKSSHITSPHNKKKGKKRELFVNSSCYNARTQVYYVNVCVYCFASQCICVYVCLCACVLHQPVALPADSA